MGCLGPDFPEAGTGEELTNKFRQLEPVRQQTLRAPIHCRGIGLHSGAKVGMVLHPAEADSGVTLVRTFPTGRSATIPGLWRNVTDTKLCTVVGHDGVTIGTVEHLMSALRGCDIDNVTVELDGPEVPVMDGSSEAFVFLIDCAGIAVQDAPRRCIRVLKDVQVGDETRTASLQPGAGASFSFEIEFKSRAIGRQDGYIPLVNGNFRSEIARARTFGFLEEVEYMRKLGLARGGSLDNAIVISDDTILNQGGLRFGDEFVRHKILDSIGDLYLAGAPIIGHYHGYKAGHALNNILLHALFADPSAWQLDDMNEDDVQAGHWTDHRLVVNG